MSVMQLTVNKISAISLNG